MTKVILKRSKEKDIPYNKWPGSAEYLYGKDKAWPLYLIIYMNQFQIDYRSKCEWQNTRAPRR